MANEITIRASLQIAKTASNGVTQISRNYSASFNRDMSGAKGPAGGVVTATTDGVDVDLSGLTTPGVCWITNEDDTNYVIVGRWDPDSSRFYPFMQIKPGESWPVPLAEDVSEEYAGTGTGTTSTASTLRIKAANQSCNVAVEAYEA